MHYYVYLYSGRRVTVKADTVVDKEAWLVFRYLGENIAVFSWNNIQGYAKEANVYGEAEHESHG